MAGSLGGAPHARQRYPAPRSNGARLALRGLTSGSPAGGSSAVARAVQPAPDARGFRSRTRGAPPRPRGPDVRDHPAQERPRAGGGAAPRRDGLRDGLAGQGHRGDRRAGDRAGAGGPPRDPAPLGSDDPRPRAPRRSCSRASPTPGIDRAFVVGGDADEPGEFLDAPVAHPGDGGPRQAAVGGGDRLLPAGPPGHPGRGAPPGASRQGAVRVST